LALLTGYEDQELEKHLLHKGFVTKFPETFASKAFALYTTFKKKKEEKVL
jgi:hypothetical protein